MCGTNVGDDSSHHALQTFSQTAVLSWETHAIATLLAILLSLLDFVVFRTRSWSPTCCRKSYMARGDDGAVLPRWPVRPQCATPTLSDRPREHMHENWYAHKGPHHCRTASVCFTPAHTDWESARVHSGLGPQRKAVKHFISFALNSSVAKLQVLCFAHEQVLYSSVWRDCSWFSKVPISSPPYFINLQVLCNLWSAVYRP